MELEVRIEKGDAFLLIDGQQGSKITVEEAVLIAFVPPAHIVTKDPGFWGRACSRMNEKNALLKIALTKLVHFASTTGVVPTGPLKSCIEDAKKLL